MRNVLDLLNKLQHGMPPETRSKYKGQSIVYLISLFYYRKNK